jgi:hypothetical protein
MEIVVVVFVVVVEATLLSLYSSSEEGREIGVSPISDEVEGHSTIEICSPML